MMTSSLRAKFERLGRVKEDDRVLSGSPETLTLRLGPDLSAAKTISAVLALRRRHVPTIKAKRAVEAAIEGLTVSFVAPMVEDLPLLIREVEECGFLLEAAGSRAVEAATAAKVPVV
jgi:hypothetical protein